MQDVEVSSIDSRRGVRTTAQVNLQLGRLHRSTAFIASFLFLFILGRGLGQATAPASAPQNPPPSATSPGTVDDVSLDLVAHDKNQKLYKDLQPTDLQVSDNGTPVKLKDLHLVSGDASAVHTVTFVSDRFGGDTGRNVQQITAKILKELPSKGYSFAVLDLVPRLRLIQGFSGDRNTIKDSIRLITEGPNKQTNPIIELEASNTVYQKAVPVTDDPSSVAAKKAEKDLLSIVRTGADANGAHVDATARAQYKTLFDALQSSRQIQQDRHSPPSLAGLLALVRSQEKIKARKCIVYFTLNTQMDSAAKEMVKSIADAANQAGVTLYVVDMDALDVGGRHQIDNALGSENVAFNAAPVAPPGSDGHGVAQVPSQQMGPTGPSSNVGMAVDWLRQSDRNPFADVHSPMADMARETGGSYIDAQDNLKKPLQQLIDDMTTYYVATYAPPMESYDGTFRTIDIKPVRKNLVVKGKTGYMAVDPGSESGVRPFEAPLLKILADATPPTDIKFRATVLHFGEMGEGDTSSAIIEIPIGQLETKTDQHTNLFSAHVAVVGQIKDKSGTVIEHFGEDVAHRAAVETMDRDKAAKIEVARHFLATPGQYTLEIAVQDRMSDKVGVQRVNFEIPPSTSGPSLSDVVLVKKVDNAQHDDDPDEPLIFEKGRVTPDIDGDIPQGAKSVSLFFIVHPDPTSKDPVKVEMQVSRNSRPGRLNTLPINFDDSHAAVPYLASFNSGLPPGDYSVKAVITQGTKTFTKDLAFTVEGEQSAPSESGNAIAGLHSDSAGENVVSGADLPKGALAITPATNVVQPPSPDELKQLITDTRTRALNYMDTLPNFMCIEVTSRSFDQNGNGKWKLRDTVMELLRYQDKKESRSMLEIDGKPATNDRDGMKGTFSSGELGGVLRAVFSEKAKAEFEWKETDTLGTSTVQVFNYHVDQKNSEFSVVGMNNLQVMVGFHGQVYIDAAAHNVRRVTLIADNLPKDFPTHYTSIAVDYDYVSINNHDYLMPITAQLRLKEGRRQAALNNMEFRDYRRFGSSMRIIPDAPEEQKQ